MKPAKIIALATISLTGVAQAAHGSEFLLDKAADFYCGSMEGMNPREMTTYDRGLYEGMAFGFVLGQYPEQADNFEKMSDKQVNDIFYPLVKQKCPSKSFQ
jgi:hypothetical protein